ncbi:MAG TPA: class I SAM-dependent methyltransferase [Opitutaceae bacterium]|nr:class I SAM-dependent methyltransferase [Opitutaceae bacterium]
MLDAACGAIPHREYLAFSDNYETRICVDFSIRALSEARAKLGNRGLYLLGDITRLPLADSSVDAVISLHTIYHVPQPEQTTAVDELVRVTRSGGRVVIVYVWAYSLAMDAIFKLRGWLGFVRRLGRPPPVAGAAGGAAAKGVPSLYFRPQDHDWFAHDVAARHSARLKVWSAVSKAFQTRFVSDGLIGRLTIAAVKLFENVLPGVAGRIGQYPMFIIDKP